MKKLDSGFRAHFELLIPGDWAQIIEKFKDGNIFQTFAYGAETWGVQNLDHFVLKYDNEIVSAAQIWIKKIPFLNKSIAHISYGPVWILKEKDINITILKNALRALFSEYVENRNFLLRVRPNIIEGSHGANLNDWVDVFEEENLRLEKSEYRYRTIKLDLNSDLEDIKSNFRKSWRKCLRRAEKNSLDIIVTDKESDLLEFEKLYMKMMERKNVSEYIEDVSKWININKKLYDSLKLKLFLTKNKTDIISGIIISKIGDTALGLMSASSKIDIENKYNSTYLLDWEIIKYLKTINCRYYDLRGYSPKSYPGPSYYKAGVGGDDVRFVGIYEGCRSLMISKLCSIGKKLDAMNTKVKSLRLIFRRKIVLMFNSFSCAILYFIKAQSRVKFSYLGIN